jgi:hypothetical protein
MSFAHLFGMSSDPTCRDAFGHEVDVRPMWDVSGGLKASAHSANEAPPDSVASFQTWKSTQRCAVRTTPRCHALKGTH